MAKYIRKGLLPIIGFMAILIIFKGVYIVDGNVDWFRLWMLIGIPFGVTRIMIWFIPRGFDIGSTLGMFAFSIIISGMIGGIIALVVMLESVFYLMGMPFYIASGKRGL